MIQNKILSAIPGYPEGAEVVADGDGAWQIIVEHSSADAWRGYCGKLTDAGFALLWERAAAGNLFAAYREGSCGVTTYFTPFNSTFRIIVEPYENMSDNAADCCGERICKPLLTQIGRTFMQNNYFRGVPVNCGLMCYVLRLEDGRCIVIDGGVANEGFADGIMNVLKKQAPDPENIVVAAWIITHTHNDHTGGFIKFTEKYYDCPEVRIDELICNYPGERDCIDWFEKNEYFLRQRSIANFRAFNREGKVTKIHTGEVRHIGGAEIEFLATQEDFRTSFRSWKDTRDWNNTSVVFRVREAGYGMMFLADACIIENDILTAMYGSYLKSDFCQTAHHGGKGGTVEVYTAIDPEVATYTTSDEALTVYLGDRANAHLANELHVKEILNAANRITELDIPYVPGTSRVIDNEADIKL